MHASTLAPKPPFRFLVHGLKGSYLKSGLDPQENRLKVVRPGADLRNLGVEEAGDYGTFYSSQVSQAQVIKSHNGKYLDFYRNLAQCLRGGSPPPVMPKEANTVIELIEKARLSQEKGAWVPV